MKVELDRKVRYELDGGDRSKVKSFNVKVEARALMCAFHNGRERTV